MESHYFLGHSDAVRGLESLAGIGFRAVRERPEARRMMGLHALPKKCCDS
jgi:hypothetical protein